MRLKTYFSTSVESALNTARLELGPDAMLVHSRRRVPAGGDATSDSVPSGDYEVVFAIGADAEPASSRANSPTNSMALVPTTHTDQPGPNSFGPSAGHAGIDLIGRDVAQMRLRIEQVAAVIQRTELAQRRRSIAARTSPALYADLRDTDLTEQFILEILGSLTPENSTRAGAIKEVSSRTRVAPEVGRAGFARQIVLLAGAAGTGKTTLAAKIAVRFGLALHKPTHMISLDSGRVGGSDLLATLASLLGTGFSRVETPQGLLSTLDHLRHQDLIVIDTPGFSPAEAQEIGELARAIAHRPEIETQLVLASTCRLNSLRHQMALFAPLNPAKLILTRLDESGGLGQTLEAILGSGLPVSFVSAGQNIPDDLEPADPFRLAELALCAPLGAVPPNIMETTSDSVRRAAA